MDHEATQERSRTTATTTASHVECLRGLAKIRDGFAQFEHASRGLREELLRCGRFQQANDVEKVRIQVEEMGGTPAVDRARQRLAFCFGDPGTCDHLEIENVDCSGGTGRCLHCGALGDLRPVEYEFEVRRYKRVSGDAVPLPPKAGGES